MFPFWTILLVVIGSQCSLQTSAKKELSDKYHLLSVVPRTDDDIKTLHDIRATVRSVDYWTEPKQEVHVPVLIPDDVISQFKRLIERAAITFHVLSDDVERDLRENAEDTEPLDSSPRAKRATDGMVLDHHKYHKLHEIYSSLEALRKKYPDNVEINNLKALTFEHEFTKSIHLFQKGMKGRKPMIFIDAGLHAREWLAPATALYIIDKLLAQHASGQQPGRQMLDNFEWLFIPVGNPDGYKYTHKYPHKPRYRYWRTNRNTSDIECKGGVDLNRNFDEHFQKPTSPGFWKCLQKDHYPGPSPFSEAETRNFRDLFNQYKSNIVAYVALHTYGQCLIIPWGYAKETEEKPNNIQEISRVGQLMVDAIHNTSGLQYTLGTAYSTVGYTAFGTSLDWVLKQKDTIYSFNYELRPDSTNLIQNPFAPKPTEIKKTGEEIYNSLNILAENIRLD